MKTNISFASRIFALVLAGLVYASVSVANAYGDLRSTGPNTYLCELSNGTEWFNVTVQKDDTVKVEYEQPVYSDTGRRLGGSYSKQIYKHDQLIITQVGSDSKVLIQGLKKSSDGPVLSAVSCFVGFHRVIEPLNY